MTIKKINNTSIESNRVVLRPHVKYEVSGSSVTGSIPLIQNPSNSIRTLNVRSANPAFGFVNVIENRIQGIKSDMQAYGSAEGPLQGLLTDVSKAPEPSKHFKQFDILIDNVPGFATGSKGVGKDIPSGTLGSVVNSMLKKQNESNENMQYGFTNYNSIGFTTSSNTNVDTALIYNQDINEDMYSFAVSFFLKPPSKTKSSFEAGTIFHIDNVVSISLVSGSNTDKNGNVSNFKIVSQLTSSNEHSPSTFIYEENELSNNQNTYSNFAKHVAYTTGSVLEKNQWYHVLVTYTQESQKSYHRIYINGNEKGFSVSDIENIYRSGSNSSGNHNPHVVIGNKISGSVNYDKFFTNEFSKNQKYESLGFSSDPIASFEAPFRGEVHEICFWSNKSDNIPANTIIKKSNKTQDGSSTILKYPTFYLPVLFNAVNEQEFFRQPLGESNSVFIKKAPHENFLLSNGMRFPSVNITSFLKAYNLNLSSNSTMYPRCVGMEEIPDLLSDPNYNLSNYSNYHDVASQIPQYFIRNNLIRSCDNNVFSHDYSEYEKIIDKTNGNKEFLKSTLGNINTGNVLIKNYVTSSNASSTSTFSYQDRSAGFTNSEYSFKFLNSFSCPVFDKNIENNISIPADHVPFTKHFSGFDHSNLVTYINIPAMFYSQRIHPGTFQMTDSDISGSDGMLTYNIKDNGLGALYRADSAAPDKRNRCGLIFYDSGIVILTHPSLCMVGRNQYSISFRGEHDLNVLNINAHAGKYEFNNSQNPGYNQIGRAGSQNNSDPVTLITGIEYLDENLNVVMKSNFSQPVSKREFDEILFRSRIDI
jgi:hypothetical protein